MSFEICPKTPDPYNDFAIYRPDVPLGDYLDVLDDQLKYWTARMVEAAPRKDMLFKTARSLVGSLIMARIEDGRQASLTPLKREYWRRAGLGHSALSMLAQQISLPDRKTMISANGTGFAQLTIDAKADPLTNLPRPIRLHIAPDQLPKDLFPPTEKVATWYRFIDDNSGPSLYVNYCNTAQVSPEERAALEEQGVTTESLASQVTFFPYLPTLPVIDS